MTVRWTVPPAPQPAAAAGHYCGFTNEGKSICFDVKADQHVVNLRTESIVTCPDSMRWLWTIGFSVPDPLRALAFMYSYSGPLAADPTDHNVSATYALAGTFDTAGNLYVGDAGPGGFGGGTSANARHSAPVGRATCSGC